MALYCIGVHQDMSHMMSCSWSLVAGNCRRLCRPYRKDMMEFTTSRVVQKRRNDVVAQSAADEATTDVSDGIRIIETELHKEAEQSYLSYAMSVIVGRALPDARDGLKPVHRRILYAMHELGLQPGKPYRKSARVVGEVLGKFHPHGDTAVYDTLVRMAQDFSLRLPLISGHGNFGSMDDDPPAAMRYTECRLEPVAAAALLSDLESDTVDFLPNFDASTEEPVVLPAKVPLMLVNGSSGIAVGIATKIPPHNLREVVQGLIALIENPNIGVPELMEYIPAPDFPTGGILVSGEGLRDAYEMGKGRIVVRAKLHVEETGKRKPSVIITELPYQTNKADLVAQIANLVDEGKIVGVSDIRDESDRSGMRVVIELKRGVNSEVTINQLLRHTSLESRYSCNMIALVDGLPRTMSLKDFLVSFLDFRCEVIRRRGMFQLNKASRRLHLVEGFLRTMENLDAVVESIRRASDGETALMELQVTFGFSREQAEGILALTLRRLTGLEVETLKSEETSLREQIKDIEGLLDSKKRILKVVKDECLAIASKYGSDRRTVVVDNPDVELQEVDFIPNTASIIVYSRKGFVKRMKLEQFAVQGVRGTGKAGVRFKDEDSLEDIVYVHDHDRLLFFTTEGRAYALNAYDIPESSRTSVGTAITSVLKISKASAVASLLPISQSADTADIVLCSKGGLIKRTPLKMFSKISSAGVTAIGLKDGDSLKFVGLCSPTDTVLMTSNLGYTLHFPAEVVSISGRTAKGCKGMNVANGSLVGMSILHAGVGVFESPDVEDDLPTDDLDDNLNLKPCLLLLTRKGLGKRVPIDSFKVSKARTGKGLISIRLKEDDSLAAALVVGTAGFGKNEEEIVISTVGGMLLRVALNQIAITSRYAQGYRVVKLKDGDEVNAVTLVQKCSD